MSSWQHRLLVLWLRLSRRKRIYSSVEGLYAGIRQTRRSGPAVPGWQMCTLVDVSCEQVHNRPVYHLSPKGSSSGARRLLYLHGGAYVRPITRHHWRLLQALVLDTGCHISVPLYPLAPEADCEQALGFVREVWTSVQNRSARQAPMLAGDSAGAGLALALAVDLRGRGQPQPEKLLLICPWVDLTLSQSPSAEQQRRDPMLAYAGAAEAARLYAGELGVEDPRVSPLYAHLNGLAPMTIWGAGNDLIGSDALRLAERARQHGCTVDLQIESEMIHVWPLLPTPEGEQAREYLKSVVVR